jgi:hypothetical protein
MIDQYFGVKELYEVVLKAKVPMQFGSRRLEEGEPVLYFENVSISMLSERNSPIMARGGWSNMPRVIWEDRSEVTFSLTEGVMSSISMGILLSANMTEKQEGTSIAVPMREGPFELDSDNCFILNHMPILPPRKKVFIYEYERDVGQKKVYGEIVQNIHNIAGEEIPRIRVKEADATKHYMVDYYYEYKDEALIYLIQKERFNGLFTLEGKFYSKDENDGLNYTNLIYMPKVRVVSDINLRLGERADPTTSVFNIVGMPEKTDDSNNLIVRITRLNQDIDADI